LLDHLIRTYFKTREFEKDVTYILTIMRQAGITSDDLKPGYIGQNASKEKGDPEHDKVVENDLRLVGIGLGSFVDTASTFYEYYRKNPTDDSIDELNRHAVIHCAPVNFNSKLHAAKLLTFIDLTLELEPVFKILLAEDWIFFLYISSPFLNKFPACPKFVKYPAYPSNSLGAPQ